MSIYINLLGAALLPVIVSICFYLLKRTTPFGKLKFFTKQIIIGIGFGIVSIMGTVFGVDVGGATANARDAAPLCAGLLFGGPAGIISGIMGGVYRWFAAAWGAGTYTKIACSVSTVLSGVFAALLRKYIFENRRPLMIMGASIGVIAEVFHMTMVFLTHMDDASNAFDIIKICTGPMIICNAVSVGLACLALEVLSAVIHKGRVALKSNTITERIQTSLLVCVLFGFFVTTAFIYVVETNMTNREINSQLSVAISDIDNQIDSYCDEVMVDLALAAAGEIDEHRKNGEPVDVLTMAEEYKVSELHIINTAGKIIQTTVPEYIGFDMYSGNQSREFMSIVDGSDKYVVQDFQQMTFDNGKGHQFRKYAGAALGDGGLVQIGYNRDAFHKLVETQVIGSAEFRHIGNTGYMIITDSKHRIVSDNKNRKGMTLVGTKDFNWNTIENGKPFETVLYNEPCFCEVTESQGFYILAVYPKAEALRARDISVYINCFMQVLVYALLFMGINIMNRFVVVNEIRKVNKSLNKITMGNLEEKVEVRSSREFDELSTEINQTVGRLEELTEEAKRRLDKELEIAKNIQHSALPTDFDNYNRLEKIEIYATMNAAKEVGGDFYDFFLQDDKKFAFGISDVSGKGIPGAMFMMRSKVTIRSHMETGFSVEDAFTESNSRLCEGNDAELFVTSWMGVLDMQTGHVDFANAGHNPPLVYRKGEGYSYLKSKVGFVLAGLDGVKYKKQELDLNPGDKIFLYTDGVTEAQNLSGELYGEERLLSYLNAHCEDNSVDTLTGVKADVDAFVGEAEQFDDITMLTVEYKGV